MAKIHQVVSPPEQVKPEPGRPSSVGEMYTSYNDQVADDQSAVFKPQIDLPLVSSQSDPHKFTALQPVNSQPISSLPIASQTVVCQPMVSPPMASHTMVNLQMGSGQPLISHSIVSQQIVSQPHVNQQELQSPQYRVIGVVSPPQDYKPSAYFHQTPM